MLSTVNDSTSILSNPHLPLDPLPSNNENFSLEVSSRLEKIGKVNKKIAEAILEENNQKNLSKLQPSSKAISKADKPKTEKPQLKKKIAALLNSEINSTKLQSFKIKPEKKNKNITPTQKEGDTSTMKKELKISDFFKQNANSNPHPISKNSLEKIFKGSNNEEDTMNPVRIEALLKPESPVIEEEEKLGTTEAEKQQKEGELFEFEVKRIWYDCNQKDILFEYCASKEDEEARSIVSRRDLARKDSCMLLNFYEKYLDFSQFSNVKSDFKLKPALVNGGKW